MQKVYNQDMSTGKRRGQGGAFVSICGPRDNWRCRKCGRGKNQAQLDGHHIVAKMDGGGDELNNLITLCSACHGEWEVAEATCVVTFEEWLTYPPYVHLLSLWMLNQKPEADFTSAQFVVFAQDLNTIRREYGWDGELHAI